MVGVARGLLANEAGLVADKQQMRLAALARRLLGMGQSSFLRRRQSRLQRGLGGGRRERFWRRALRSI
ncbi:hypothetical protein ACVWXO_005432 [Bradyrhizobium sp. LM2.7]